MSKIFRASFFVVAALLMSRQAQAASILISTDKTFTVNWLNTTTNPDIAGSATFAITNYSATGFDLAITSVRNTMPTTPDINARFVSFAFGLTPDATFSLFESGDVFKWEETTQFPGAFNGKIDVCGYAGPNCSGGGGGGLDQGKETLPGDIMSVHVAGDFALGVTFNPIVAKFQTKDYSSFELDGCVVGPECPGGRTGDDDPLATPEPASLILLGSGLAFVVLRRRRKS